MSTNLKDIVPPEMNAEDQAIIEHIMTGKPLDPQLRERAQRITQQIYEKHGLLDHAVPSIRELRDSE